LFFEGDEIYIKLLTYYIPSMTANVINNVIDTTVPSLIPTQLSHVNSLPDDNRESSEINHLETLSKNLMAEQMYIPTGMVCAEISHHYFENARQIIREFMDNPELRVVVYGYSSGGARIHKLFRASNGDIFQVYDVVGRGPRIYFLTHYLLEYIYEYSNTEMPAFAISARVQDVIDQEIEGIVS
jgi:hypothetical protein